MSTPFERVVYWLLGVAGVVAGFRVVSTGVAAFVLVLGSICFVAWTARRAAGLALAFAAGAIQLAGERAQGEPIEPLILAGLWTLLYVFVAVTTSAIEVATRPQSK